MKIIYFPLLSLSLLRFALAAEPISIDEFKKLSITGQLREIDRAAPERRAELRKIHTHAALLVKYGEEGLKREKERAVGGGRDHVGITRLFLAASEGWNDYLLRVILANEKKRSGATQKDQKMMDEEEDAIQKKYDAAQARYGLACTLVYLTASTPEVIARAMSAEKMSAQYLGDDWKPVRVFSEKELDDLDKITEELLAELKKLPRLPQEQLQREIDAYPEEYILLGR